MSRARDVRASVPRGEAAARILRHSKSPKSWIQDDRKSLAAAAGDARERNIDPERAQKIVSCVTSFTTCMCVVIAIVKVGVYLKSGAAVVRTSALDSLGDLLANLITLYTGYLLGHADLRKNPLGSHRFEQIGVLVFSTLMAAMMLGNALDNVEKLASVPEKERAEALVDFWRALFGTREEHRGGEVTRADPELGFSELKKVLPDVSSLSSLLRSAFAEATFGSATGAIRGKIEVLANVASDTDVWHRLLFQNKFLGMCATYKCCLFLYCRLVAIPRTGSAVLVALANDKRNDFVATSFVITSTFLGFHCKDFLDGLAKNGAAKVDPVVSLILSCVIIYTWVSLAAEQVALLSMQAVEPELFESVGLAVSGALDRGNYATGNLKAYYSSARYTVEVDVHVVNPQTPFREVSGAMESVRNRLSESDNLERTVVVPV